MADMTFVKEGDLLILVHNKTNPTPEAWAAYCQAIKTYLASGDAVRVLLVVSEAGGPNAKQRREVIEAFGSTQPLTAVCSNSALARGITTAIAWLFPKLMMSYRYEDVVAALDGLGVPRDKHVGITARVIELQRKVSAKPFR